MATAVFDRFTRAAPGESPGRTKPGAQWDSRRYRLLITDYRLPITGVSFCQIFQLAKAC
jgi:hypothetical protein